MDFTRKPVITKPRQVTGVVNVYTNASTPFAASVTTKQQTQYIAVDGKTLFVDMAAALLDFFAAGRPSIPRAESLAVRRILDAAGTKQALKGWVKL